MEKFKNCLFKKQETSTEQIFQESKKPYYLNERLQFLLPYLKPNNDSPTPKNLPSPSSEHEIILENNEQSDIEDQYADLIQQEKNSSDNNRIIVNQNQEKRCFSEVQQCSQAKNIHKKRKSDVSKADQSFIDFVNMKKNKTHEEDARQMFLLSLLPDVKTMTDKQMRAFGKKVLDVIDDVLTGNPTPQNQIPITTTIPSGPQTISSTLSSSSLYSYDHTNRFTLIHSPEESHFATETCNENENAFQDLINM